MERVMLRAATDEELFQNLERIERRMLLTDLFNIAPVEPTPKYFHNDHTTRRTKVNTVKNTDPDTQIHWKNTSISYIYEDVDGDENIQPVREKQRKQSTLIPTLAPIFNFFTTTTQSNTKRNKATNRRTDISNNNESRKNINNNVRLSYEIDQPKNRRINTVDVNPEDSADYFTRPYYEFTRPYYEVTRRPNDYYNNNYYSNDYTPKNPLLNRPGVRPAVVENRPPITNKPPTRRPGASVLQPEQTTVRNVQKTTPRPYIVNPIPTDAGAVVFPHENDEPQIIKGVDEDYMSDAEKRRYIELSERMCDKYKALNTKQLSAIPLLPSPEPVSVNVSQCSPLNVPLVIGGKVVSIRDFPHAALLGWEKIDEGGYSWKCGGSLISEQWILTAAHCSYEERDNTVVTGPPKVVQLGSSYLDDPGALVVRVGSVVRHPKYKFPRSYYDIALLKLVQPVKFSEVIKPACLGVPPAVHYPIIAVGWGKTQLGGNLSLELRAVSIPVWDLGRCKDVLGTSRKMPDGPLGDSQLCAGEERGGKDTCQGDSGGPAQIQDGCVWRVVAVTSLGRSCGAPNTPGLYAIAQRPFIAATVLGDFKNNNRRPDNNNNKQNDYPTGNTNDNPNYYDGNNKRPNDYSNVNNNKNGYDVNNNNERRNDYPNVNRNNDRKHNDYSTTELYYNYNTRKTKTTTESYYNQDFNNGNHDQNGNRKNDDRRNPDSFGNNNDNPTYISNNNKRTEYDTNYYNPDNTRQTSTTTQVNIRRTDYDNVYHNQPNNQNHHRNQNKHRQNNNNQNYWNVNRRPNYGTIYDGPIWWT